MDTIKSLFNGKIKVFENMEYDSEYAALNKKLEELLDITDEKIQKDGKTYFSDKLRNAILDVQVKFGETAFTKGFALAVQLIGESYRTKI